VTVKPPVLGPEFDDPLNLPDVGRTFIIRNIKHKSHRMAFNRGQNPNTFFYDKDIYDDQFWTLETCTVEENLGVLEEGQDPNLIGCAGYYYLKNHRNPTVRLASNPDYGTYGWWEGPLADQLWKFERVAEGQYYIINKILGCKLYTHGDFGNTIGCFKGEHNDD
jgi:hypothetical protein